MTPNLYYSKIRKAGADGISYIGMHEKWLQFDQMSLQSLDILLE